MRAASFKMGSIAPEHHSYKPSTLAKGQGSAASIGLASQSANAGFRPAVKATINSQQVSAGNNIARGRGQFQTVNQAFTGWI